MTFTGDNLYNALEGLRPDVSYARSYPQRRLVVLAGFFHRYYLRRELAAGQVAGHYQLIKLNGQATPAP